MTTTTPILSVRRDGKIDKTYMYRQYGKKAVRLALLSSKRALIGTAKTLDEYIQSAQ